MSNNNYTERHLFDAGGHTPNNYYIRIVNRGNSKIWDNAYKVLKAIDAVTWANSAKELVEEGTTGTYPIIIPVDWRTVDDIALELYNLRVVDLPDVKKETISWELYGKPVSELTVGEDTIVVAEWETRNAYRIAVGAAHAARVNLPAGTYDIIVYKVIDSGGIPDHEDDVEKQFETKVGGIFGF